MWTKLLTDRYKPLTVAALYKVGFFEILRYLQRKRVTILMYHRFSDTTENFKLSRHVFERQLNYLKHRYNIISFKEYSATLSGSLPQLPPNPLIITIDDGYLDNYEYAFPLIKKYNVPITIFLTTDFISKKAWLWSNKLEYILKNSLESHFVFPVFNREIACKVDTFTGWHQAQLTLFNYCRTLANEEKDSILDELAQRLGVRIPDEVTDPYLPLSWEQIREMHNTGLVSYGAHTCSHPILSQLSKKELKYELSYSKREIENNIEVLVETFCYPNGQPEDVTQSVIEQVRLSGYSSAVSTLSGFNYPDNVDPYFLKRIAVTSPEKILLSRDLTR